MIKKNILFVYFILSLVFTAQGKSPVESILGIPFGSVCTLKAEFIEKPDTYYARNISPAPFYLKIIEINGNILKSPVIAEPECGDIKFEKGKIYSLKAFETIQTEGEPYGWSKEISQINFSIRTKIKVKPL